MPLSSFGGMQRSRDPAQARLDTPHPLCIPVYPNLFPPNPRRHFALIDCNGGFGNAAMQEGHVIGTKCLPSLGIKIIGSVEDVDVERAATVYWNQMRVWARC